ncbi:10132_t:CDS:2 [Scutellospora calospora]|uniref:10132_t:CDS:1 n=1 Tax=Scutellospora calospora TaxID=85575 RepID=A0ACA9KPU3_9GLOM|nr:10132_t:CDS:2 [Scutellospora calospora]
MHQERNQILSTSFLSKVISAHEHHEHHETNETDNDNTSLDPIDGILLTHIVFMFLAFAIIFPMGMVLGLSRSRWHVPLQIIGSIFMTIGYFLGHAHGGREFSSNNIHSLFAPYLIYILICQVGVGVYLKLHLKIGPNKWFRPLSSKFHKILGISILIIGYIQIVFGVITVAGWCGNGNLEQCLAHFIMGSSFTGYGIILILVLRLASGWLQRKGKSQDYYDSWMIMVWGAVNTFTEHRGPVWSHKDLQHTSLGILWWAGGAVGIYLSKNGKRNIMPAIVILFTGYAMSSHAQPSEISTKIHSIFGYVLMGASLARIFEICLLFMGANPEQIALLTQLNIDPYSYALVLASTAFLIFLFPNLLIDLYWRSGQNDGEPIGNNDIMAHLPLPLTDPHISSSNSEDDHSVLFQRKSNDDDYEFHNLLECIFNECEEVTVVIITVMDVICYDNGNGRYDKGRGCYEIATDVK